VAEALLAAGADPNRGLTMGPLGTVYSETPLYRATKYNDLHPFGPA
jgi:hypothetical protein